MPKKTKTNTTGKGQSSKKAQTLVENQSHMDDDILSDDEYTGSTAQNKRIEGLQQSIKDASKKRMAQAESSTLAFKKRVKTRQTEFLHSLSTKVDELSTNDADFKKTFQTLVKDTLSSTTTNKGGPTTPLQLDYTKHPIYVHQKQLTLSSNLVLDSLNTLNSTIRDLQLQASCLGQDWASQDADVKDYIEGRKEDAMLQISAVMGFKTRRGVEGGVEYIVPSGESWTEMVAVAQKKVDWFTADMDVLSTDGESDY